MLADIAQVLNVSVLTLEDPNVENPSGAMHTLFELEKMYGLRPKRKGEKLLLIFGDGCTGDINAYLNEWEKEYQHIKFEMEAADTEEGRKSILQSYRMWKWNFPGTKQNQKESRKVQLEKLLEKVQKELDEFD